MKSVTGSFRDKKMKFFPVTLALKLRRIMLGCRVLPIVGAIMMSNSSYSYEQSVKCASSEDPNPYSFYPYEVIGIFGENAAGERRVAFALKWRASDLLKVGNFGMEFKTHEYNYDDAEMTKLGPAYILGVQGALVCDLPGCYADPDFLSEKNSYGEYREPQVAIGVRPEFSDQIQSDKLYSAEMLGIPGRGNEANIKVIYYTTKRVLPIGSSGIFHCSDVVLGNPIRYSDGFFVPGCFYLRDIRRENC